MKSFLPLATAATSGMTQLFVCNIILIVRYPMATATCIPQGQSVLCMRPMAVWERYHTLAIDNPSILTGHMYVSEHLLMYAYSRNTIHCHYCTTVV